MVVIKPNPTYHPYELETIWLQFNAGDIPIGSDCCDTGFCCNYGDPVPSEVCQTVALVRLSSGDADGRECVWGTDSEGPTSTSAWRLWFMPNGKWVLYNLCQASCHLDGGDTTWTIPFVGASTTSFRSQEMDWNGCSCQFFTMLNGYPDVYVIPGPPLNQQPPYCGNECGSSSMSMMSFSAAGKDASGEAQSAEVQTLCESHTGCELYTKLREAQLRAGGAPKEQTLSEPGARRQRPFAWRKKTPSLTERPDQEEGI